MQLRGQRLVSSLGESTLLVQDGKQAERLLQITRQEHFNLRATVWNLLITGHRLRESAPRSNIFSDGLKALPRQPISNPF